MDKSVWLWAPCLFAWYMRYVSNVCFGFILPWYERRKCAPPKRLIGTKPGFCFVLFFLIERAKAEGGFIACHIHFAAVCVCVLVCQSQSWTFLFSFCFSSLRKMSRIKDRRDPELKWEKNNMGRWTWCVYWSTKNRPWICYRVTRCLCHLISFHLLCKWKIW